LPAILAKGAVEFWLNGKKVPKIVAYGMFECLDKNNIQYKNISKNCYYLTTDLYYLYDKKEKENRVLLLARINGKNGYCNDIKDGFLWKIQFPSKQKNIHYRIEDYLDLCLEFLVEFFDFYRKNNYNSFADAFENYYKENDVYKEYLYELPKKSLEKE
jgi:hypothetical protein